MKKKTLAAAALAAFAWPAFAGDFSNIANVTQDQFRALSEDLGAAFSYKGVTPATPLGPLGFDIGLELTDTRIENGSAFSAAGAGSFSDILVPKLHVYKGLPSGFDIGAFIGGASEVNATLFGVDMRYAFLNDTLTTPAVAMRVSGTHATGLGDLRVSTGAVDLMVSKKLALATPYAGGGVVWTWSAVSNSALQDERQSTGRYFAGLNVNLVAANLAFEAEKMGDNTSWSAKVGWRF